MIYGGLEVRRDRRRGRTSLQIYPTCRKDRTGKEAFLCWEKCNLCCTGEEGQGASARGLGHRQKEVSIKRERVVNINQEDNDEVGRTDNIVSARWAKMLLYKRTKKMEGGG
jgi:hypothetical protein